MIYATLENLSGYIHLKLSAEKVLVQKKKNQILLKKYKFMSKAPFFIGWYFLTFRLYICKMQI